MHFKLNGTRCVNNLYSKCFSGAVTFASTMGVDAFMARTGLKMVTTLHSSTEMDGFITIEESKIVNVKFNVPKEKVEILNVQ